MQNPPTIISTAPPLPIFPPPPQPPPRFPGEGIVLQAPPPPLKPFAFAPSSVFQITVLPAPPPPPPFDGGSSSVDLSPIEFLLALVAIVTIPALIYTFIFAFGCSSSSRRRGHSAGEASVEPSVASEHSHRDVEIVPEREFSGVKYQKGTHSKEIGGECPVCLSVFADGEEVRQLSVCKHSFHTSCIDLWLSKNSNCPICRATIAAVAVKPSDSERDGSLQQHGDRDASNLV